MVKNMKVGVVAEFNPFHNGHQYQIDKINEMNPTIKIAVVSGNFVQRGELSILNKFEKASIAVENGYDLVVELPCYYSIQNAEVFGIFSTKILEKLGVELQVFGVENDDLKIFVKVIELQKTETYSLKLKELQKKGFSYTSSHQKILEELGYENWYKSNNILAISYIKSIIENSMKLRYYPIKRKNVDYNDDKILGNIASASFIRENYNKQDVNKLIPSNTKEVLESKNIDFENIEDRIFELFKYMFNVKSKNEIIKVYDYNDSIYNRIQKNLVANSSKEFFRKIVSRNISKNRVKRLMLNLLLDIQNEDIDKEADIEYIRVLAMNNNGRNYIKYLKEKNITIFVNWKDIEKNYVSHKIKIEKNAFLLYELLKREKEKLNVIYLKGEN